MAITTDLRVELAVVYDVLPFFGGVADSLLTEYCSTTLFLFLILAFVHFLLNGFNMKLIEVIAYC